MKICFRHRVDPFTKVVVQDIRYSVAWPKPHHQVSCVLVVSQKRRYGNDQESERNDSKSRSVHVKF